MLTMNMLFPAGAQQPSINDLRRPGSPYGLTGPTSGIPTSTSTDPNAAFQMLAPAMQQAQSQQQPAGKGSSEVIYGAEGQKQKTAADLASGKTKRGGQGPAPGVQSPTLPPAQTNSALASGGASGPQAQPVSPTADPDALLKYRNSLPPGARYEFDKALEAQEHNRRQRIEHEGRLIAQSAREERRAAGIQLRGATNLGSPSGSPDISRESAGNYRKLQELVESYRGKGLTQEEATIAARKRLGLSTPARGERYGIKRGKNPAAVLDFDTSPSASTGY